MPSSPSADSSTELLDLVDRVVDQVLVPAAEDVDQASELPADNFKAIADLGLYGLIVGTTDGGLGQRPAVLREVFRRLGSGCGATAFAFAQHHGTIGAVAATDNRPLREKWLPRLVTDQLAGIGYAHVRRSGPPILVAEPDGEGWILNGSAPWVTSWGFAAAFAIAAKNQDGDLVWALVPGREEPGLTAGDPFDLMVFGATQTVPLHFENYRVERDSVLSVADWGTWAARDRLLAARPNPMCFGIGDRALVRLRERAPDLADELAPWWSEVVARAEAQCVAVDDGTAEVGAVAAARAEVLAAVQRLTTALIASIGGSAMEFRNPAQRLAREALFYVVQAQSRDGRDASLHLLGPPG